MAIPATVEMREIVIMKRLLMLVIGLTFMLAVPLTACEDAPPAPPDTDTLDVLEMSIRQAQRHLGDFDRQDQINNARRFCFRALEQSWQSEGQVGQYLQRTCDAIDGIEFGYPPCWDWDPTCTPDDIANKDPAYKSLDEALSALDTYRDLTGR